VNRCGADPRIVPRLQDTSPEVSNMGSRMGSDGVVRREGGEEASVRTASRLFSLHRNKDRLARAWRWLGFSLVYEAEGVRREGHQGVGRSEVVQHERQRHSAGTNLEAGEERPEVVTTKGDRPSYVGAPEHRRRWAVMDVDTGRVLGLSDDKEGALALREKLNKGRVTIRVVRLVRPE
jgi:hypothetical protein